MLRKCIIVLLTLPTTSLGVHAKKQLKLEPSATECVVPPDQNWTPQERLVWKRVCAGESADLNKVDAQVFGGNLDPKLAEGPSR
jgi:hypothetical protein